MVKLLAARGANLDRKLDEDGLTVLHWACHNGHASMVDVLAKAGADLSVQGSKGTALHYAAFAKSREVAESLLNNGANPSTSGPGGLTALHISVFDPAEGLLKLLLRAGAHVNAKTEHGGASALHIALSFEPTNTKIIRLLLDHGADVNIRGDYPKGETPLHIAAHSGKISAAALLVSRGADVRAKCANGETALHRAASSDEAEMPQWLLDHGAQIDARGDGGDTALSLASVYGNSRAAEVLLHHGVTDLELARSMMCRWCGAHKRDECSHDPRSIYKRTGFQRDNTIAYGSGAEQTCRCVAVVLLGGGRHVEESQRADCA